MFQNAVQRLQKLHNELKSVISIYDVSNSSNVNAEPFEKGTEKRLKKIPSSINQVDENEIFHRIRHRTDRTTEYGGFKKSISFIPRPIEDFHYRDSSSTRRTCPTRKPSSAPSYSTSSSTANCEVRKKNLFRRNEGRSAKINRFLHLSQITYRDRHYVAKNIQNRILENIFRAAARKVTASIIPNGLMKMY